MRRVVLALLAVAALLLTTVQVPAQAYQEKFGRVWRADGVLHPGCRTYDYHYVVRPRADDWVLETFLSGPGGKQLGSDAVQKAAHNRRGTRDFKVCRATTHPGRFKIRGKLTRTFEVCATPVSCTTEDKVVWIKPAHFRLRHA